MADYSQMSTEDLLRVYQGTGSAVPAAPPAQQAGNDYSAMSTEDLLRIYQGTKPTYAQRYGQYGQEMNVAPTAPAPTWGETAVDVAKQIPTALVTGTEARMGAIPSLLGLAGRGAEALFGPGDPEAVAQREQLQKLIAENRGGGIAQYLPRPQTPTGQAVRNITEIASGGIGGPGGVRAGLAAGAGSEALGQATKGTAAEPYARLAGAVGGGLYGVRSADRAAANAARQQLQSDIETGTKGMYKAVEDAATNVPISPTGRINLGTQMRNELNRAGARQFNAPGAHKAVDDLVSGTTDAYDLVKWREVMKKDLYASEKGGDRFAAPILTDAIDRAIDATVPTGVGLLKQADREYSIKKLLEALDKRFLKVESQTASTASGQNLGNKYRQALTSLQGNERAMRGFTEAEKAQIQRMIDGTVTTNTLRSISNLLGGGGGLGRLATLGVGGHVLGGPGGGAAAVGAGMAARSAYNRAVANQARQLQNMAAARSTFAQGLPLIPPPIYQQAFRALPFGAAPAQAFPMGGPVRQLSPPVPTPSYQP